LVKALSVVFAVLVVLAAGIALYLPNYTKLKRLREANQELDRERQELEWAIEELEEKLQKAGNDPWLYEELARDLIGAARFRKNNTHDNQRDKCVTRVDYKQRL